MWKYIQDIDFLLLQFFNGSHSIFIDGVAVTFTSGLTWIPMYIALLYVVIKQHETMEQILFIVAFGIGCVLVASILCNGIVKPGVARLRPCSDPLLMNSIQLVGGMTDRSFSFFSAHAANTSSIAMFFSCVIRRKGIIVWLIVWSLLNCWTRLYLGMHFPSDIVVGLLVGTSIGFGMYKMCSRVVLSVTPKSAPNSAISMTHRFPREFSDIVIVTSLLTCMYVVTNALFFQ